jgi:L-ribulose-5-phosphate 3-epimerase
VPRSGPRSRPFRSDAAWAASAERGQKWGREVPLGEGDVGMERYLRTLLKLGYHGPLTIERETAHDPERQKQDIGQAVRLLEMLRSKILDGHA